MELRCETGKMHGILEDEVLEVKCASRFCGAKPGVVVLHRFDARTGKQIDTRSYKAPPTQGARNGSDNGAASVRYAGHRRDAVHDTGSDDAGLEG